MGSLRRQTYRWLGLALSAVWVVTLPTADNAVTQAMHCQRSHMPCCPRNSGSGENCSGARCTEQVPEKSESQAAKAKTEAAARSPRNDVSASSAPAPIRELTSGLRFHAAVFRLKDDLRI
jgi:hypothetical protein